MLFLSFSISLFFLFSLCFLSFFILFTQMIQKDFSQLMLQHSDLANMTDVIISNL